MHVHNYFQMHHALKLHFSFAKKTHQLDFSDDFVLALHHHKISHCRRNSVSVTSMTIKAPDKFSRYFQNYINDYKRTFFSFSRLLAWTLRNFANESSLVKSNMWAFSITNHMFHCSWYLFVLKKSFFENHNPHIHRSYITMSCCGSGLIFTWYTPPRAWYTLTMP